MTHKPHSINLKQITIHPTLNNTQAALNWDKTGYCDVRVLLSEIQQVIDDDGDQIGYC
jgi:hypothetical protein